MTIFEYYKQAYQSMKEKPAKERWQYFLDYYKWPTLITLLCIVVAIHFTVSIVNRKDTALSVIMLNSQTPYTSEFLDDFTAHAEISEDEEIRFQTEITVDAQQGDNATAPLERIIASVAIKDVDIILGPPDAFLQCAYSTSYMLADLHNFYDADTLEALADRLYYIDGAIVDQLASQDTYDTLPTFPDPKQPETMKNPIPVGFDISDCMDLFSEYYVMDIDMYLGIVVNTVHPEMALTFVDYLID